MSFGTRVRRVSVQLVNTAEIVIQRHGSSRRADGDAKRFTAAGELWLAVRFALALSFDFQFESALQARQAISNLWSTGRRIIRALIG